MTDDPTRTHRIIHEHVHDVRNSINCLDLLAVMADDQSTDPAMASTLAMMRTEVTRLEAIVNSLQLKFAEPESSTITADDLMQLWKNQIAPLENATHRIAWSPPAAPGTLTVDVNAILSVLRELVVAGWYRAGDAILQAAIRTTGTSILAEVREPRPKSLPAAEDMEEASRLVGMNGGTLEVSEDMVSGDRVVTLEFPLLL